MMSEAKVIKTAQERLSDYLKELSPRLNRFAIAHIAETVLPQFRIEEATELRAALEALQAELENARQPVSDEKIKDLYCNFQMYDLGEITVEQSFIGVRKILNRN
jgi:hypothetical protein